MVCIFERMFRKFIEYKFKNEVKNFTYVQILHM